jgi:hypothetical protein
MMRSQQLLKNSLLGCLFLTLSFGSIASDSDRITQLEKEISELKTRLTSLESPVNKAIVQKSVLTNDGWKNLANWRLLKKGASFDDVRVTLGEPEKVRASGPFTYWSYSNRSEATFMDDRLYGWTEPR